MSRRFRASALAADRLAPACARTQATSAANPRGKHRCCLVQRQLLPQALMGRRIPFWPRSRRAFRCAVAGALHLTSLAASGRGAQLDPVDANAAPAPLAPTPFSALEAATRMPRGTLSGALRVSMLLEPVSLVLATPSAEGARSAAVDGAILTELALSAGVGLGFDVSVGAGLHAYQWGSGYSAVTGGEGLRPVAAREPRVSIGWSKQWNQLSLRPYLTLFVPVGSLSEFSGEEHVSAEGGAAASHAWRAFLLQWDIGVRLRDPVTVGYATLGTQLKIGAGALITIVRQLAIGPELLLLPSLASQSAPPGENPGFLFPAEARMTLRYSPGKWSFGASVGAGLPLSRLSSFTAEPSWVRGMTSPSFRGLIEMRAAF